MKNKKKSFFHLDIYKRMEIQGYIEKGLNQSQIAQKLKVNRSTISREFKRNCKYKKGKFANCGWNKVCNYCEKRNNCQKSKKYYDYLFAQEITQINLIGSRKHSYLNKEEIETINETITEGILNGQSLHHVYYTNKENLKNICSESTIRRMIYRNELCIKPYQLPKKARFSNKKSAKPQHFHQKNISILIGRNMKNYQEYTKIHPSTLVSQYDSVVGKIKDKQAILTIHFPRIHFQIGFIIKKSNPSSVNSIMRHLFNTAGENISKKYFKIMLCDNGVEFNDFYLLEGDENGERVRKVFYTNVYKATDKSECERNHQFLRRFYPKHKSLDSVTQSELNDVFSHINSYVRPSLNNQTPYELAVKIFGTEFLDKIGIKKIEKEKVRIKSLI